jgi:hypothetical protein
LGIEIIGMNVRTDNSFSSKPRIRGGSGEFKKSIFRNGHC